MSTVGRDRGGRARVLAVAAVAWGSVYLTWRIGWSLGGASRWLSIPLLVAEIVTVLRFGLFVVAAWRVPDHRASRPVAASTVTALELLVPVAHADVEDLGRTLVVAAADPPTRIRVLDSQQRDDVEAEALRHGAAYEVFDLEGTAAAPDLINAALPQSAAPLIAWIDAGDVLAPGLTTLIAHFEDPSVAVVQATVNFSNRDSLLHSTPDRDENAVTERVIAPVAGAAGHALWAGSGSVLRQCAVVAVGGLSTAGPNHAVAERVATRLVAAGWRVEFSEQPAVRVVAPDTLAEYLATVGDDVAGSWSALFSAQSPLRQRGLTLRHRLLLVERGLRPLDGLVRLTLLSVLALTLFTGRLPLHASWPELAFFWAPALALRSSAQLALARGTLRRGDLSRQSLRRMGVHLGVLFGRPRRASVAGRDHPTGITRRASRVLGGLPLVTTAGIVLNVGILARGATVWFPSLLRPFSDSARIAVMAAAVAAVIPIVDVLGVLVARVQRRAGHRVDTVLIAAVDGVTCRVLDLTPHGMGFDLIDTPAVGARIPITVAVPRAAGGIDHIELTGVVRHISEAGIDDAGRPRRRGKLSHRVGVQLVDVTPPARDALVEICALTAAERDRVRERVARLGPDQLEVASSSWRTAFATLNVVGVLAAGLVVMAVPAAAAPGGGGPPAMPAPGTATITGTLVDPQGNPVEGFCVDSSSTTGGRAWGVSDAQGSFQLHQVTAGDNLVYARDCQARGGFAATYNPSTAAMNLSQLVSVADMETVDIAITMIPTATADGAITDGNGVALSGMCIAFAPEGTNKPLPVAMTASDGGFTATIPAVRGSFQAIDCMWTGRATETWYPGVGDQASADRFDIAAGSTTHLGTFTMLQQTTVSGRVTGPDGNPLDGVCVSVQDVVPGQWTWLGSGVTDQNGEYQFPAPTGVHTLRFGDCSDGRGLVAVWHDGQPAWATPPPLTIAPGPNVGLDQQMITGGVIAGLLSDPDGNPPADVCVAVHPTDRLLDDDWISAYWGTPDAATGAWTSHPLVPGSYIVQYVNCTQAGYQSNGEWREEFHSGVFNGDDREISDSVQFDVPDAGHSKFLTHSLTRATQLSGTVSANGAPAENVCVGVSPGDHNDRTGPDGRWSVSLYPGAYRVTLTDCEPARGLVQDTIDTSVNDGDDGVEDYSMQQGAAATIRGHLVTASHQMAGTGGNVSGCIVAYTPNDGIGVALVDSDGAWEISGLGAGRYWLAAIDCDDALSDLIDSETGDAHPPTWYPSAPAFLNSEADPGGDGGELIDVASGADLSDLDICLGACAAGGRSTPTSTAPTTTTPTTTTVPTAPATASAPPSAPPTVPPTNPADAPLPGPGLTRAVPAPTGPTTTAPSERRRPQPPEDGIGADEPTTETAAGQTETADAATAGATRRPAIDSSTGWKKERGAEVLARHTSRTAAAADAPTELAAREAETASAGVDAPNERQRAPVLIVGVLLLVVAVGALYGVRLRSRPPVRG